MKTIYVFPERCIGCKHCEIMCSVEHSKSKNLYDAIFEEPVPTSRIHVMPSFDMMSYPGKCRHCNPTPCIQVCPSGAISRDKETDTILLDEEKCVACCMCAIVCSLDVITFHPSWHISINKEVAIKCDNCFERITNELNPVCVEVCKTGALDYGEINEIIKEERKAVAKKVASAEAEFKPQVPELIKLWRDLGFSMMKVGEEK